MSGSAALVPSSPWAQFLIVVLGLLPLILVTKYDDTLELFCSVVVGLNSLIRMLYPSCYVPAAQAKPGLLHNPLFARALATVAEIIFYNFATVFLLGANQYWTYPYTGYITLFGETLCWLHIYYQSELLGWLEDSTWTFLQILFFCCSEKFERYYVCLPFIVYMVAYHLPRMYARWKNDFPFVHKFNGIKILKQDSDTEHWMTMSLVLKPIVFAIFIA